MPVAAAALVFLALPAAVLAQPPAWWASRGVTNSAPSDDFAAANIGQLKHIASKTVDEMEARLPGGAGPDLLGMVARWRTPENQLSPPGAPRDEYAAVNIGQLKFVAKPFYDRLAQVFWSYNSGTATSSAIDPAWAKPWTDTVDDDDDHAMANLGQLKRVFAIDFDSDGDHDALSNLAELWANQERSLTDTAQWSDLSNPDSDSDGLSDGQEDADGTNPRNRDTDSDGVFDNADRFPNDPRRTDEYVPKYYAVLDLSEYLPANIRATFDPEQIAIDDSHNVAFFGTSLSTGTGGRLGHVCRWQNGAFSVDQSFPMSVNWGEVGLDYSWVCRFFPFSIGSVVASSAFAATGINESGTLIGRTETDFTAAVPVGHPAYPSSGSGSAAWETAWSSLTSCPEPRAPIWTSPEPELFGWKTGVNNQSSTLGWDMEFTPYPGSPHDGTLRFRTLFDNVEVPRLSEGPEAVFQFPSPYSISAYGLNNRGAFLVSGDVSTGTASFLAYKYYENGALRHAPLGVYRMNDAHQAIGREYPLAGNPERAFPSSTVPVAWFAYETGPGNFEVMPLLDLLRWTRKTGGTRDDWDKYKNAIKNIYPKFLSDRDPNTQGATIDNRSIPGGVPRYIIFNAEFADNDAPTAAANTTWNWGEFALEFDTSEADPDKWHYRLLTPTMPKDAPFSVTAMNRNGTFAGSAWIADSAVSATQEAAGPANPPRRRSATAVLFEFKPRLWIPTAGTDPVDLLIGFDPPIDGDRISAVTSDETDPKWWASMTTQGNLATNQKLRVTLGPHPDGLRYRLVPTGNLDQKLTVTPNEIVNTADLTLQATGAAAGLQQPVTGTVGALQIAPGGQNPKLLKGHNLSVAMFPPLTVKIGVYFLDDPTTPLDNVPNLKPVSASGTSGIITELNKAFSAAGIQFELENNPNLPPQNSLSWGYNTEPKDGTLSLLRGSQEAEYVFQREANFPAKLNIILVKGLTYSVPSVGLCPIWNSGQTELVYHCVFVAWGNDDGTARDAGSIKRTCAHEVGHALRISTRTGEDRTRGHDGGPFPDRALQELAANPLLRRLGLMYHKDFKGPSDNIVPRDVWVRHEDWFQAWTTAKIFFP